MSHLTRYHLVLLRLAASPGHETCRHLGLDLAHVTAMLLLKLCELLPDLFELFKFWLEFLLLLLVAWNHLSINPSLILLCQSRSWVDRHRYFVFLAIILFSFIVIVIRLQLLEPVWILRLISARLREFELLHFLRKGEGIVTVGDRGCF